MGGQFIGVVIFQATVPAWAVQDSASADQVTSTP